LSANRNPGAAARHRTNARTTPNDEEHCQMTTDHCPPNDAERTRCEVWTRVMGYHRPIAAFNTGKRSEHGERRYFVEQPKGHAADHRPHRFGPPRRTAAA
jgi:hypothetical protein